jgi:DNA replication licensing factor MCM5
VSCAFQEFYLEVDLAHVNDYDPLLQQHLQTTPATYINMFEEAAQEVVQQLVVEGAEEDDWQGDSKPKISVYFTSSQNGVPLRSITALEMNKLLKVPGIVIGASRIRAKATTVTIRCRQCSATKVLSVPSAFGGVAIPRFCDTETAPGEVQCPQDPYIVMADQSSFMDQQTLKLQETPEDVPTGEMPRHLMLSVERHLVDKVPPGTRVSVMGISMVFNSGSKNQGGGGGSQVAVRTPYLRVVGIQIDTEGAGRAGTTFTPAEEEQFLALSRQPEIYEKLSASISPSISGDYTVDIKKAIACLLFSGTRKCLPDGMKLRGDINVLLMGDPSTAKSQFLKFVEKVAPVGVYTSGKGSSAAGLTASVVKDAKGEFYLEGGAMVMGDGGVVCIDEFDKMREDDRVAIHEAMEQQTISIAKAGITTILNSRTSVLAAANPVYGRYDDMKSASENIDLMTTILSRFDLIFIVRDVRDTTKDRLIARHVMNVHINATSGNSTEEGEIDIKTFKKYVAYCRNRCAPRLSEDAAELLRNNYVKIRDSVRKQTHANGEPPAVPITVRQLEALVRISESLAKMSLSHEAGTGHVMEAIRLFNVSTMTASSAGNNASQGAGSLDMDTRKKVERMEDQIKRRIHVGASANARKLVDDMISQGNSDFVVKKAIMVMQQRGELLYRNNNRVVQRLR